MNQEIVIAIIFVFLTAISFGITKLYSVLVIINKNLLKCAELICDKYITNKRALDDQLKKLINSNQKTTAINKYRNITGEGLKEAKSYIDKLIESEINNYFI